MNRRLPALLAVVLALVVVLALAACDGPPPAAEGGDAEGPGLAAAAAPLVADDVRTWPSRAAGGALFDLDGDGRLDVAHCALVDSSEHIVVRDPRTGEVLAMPEGRCPYRLAAGDLDGDLDADLVTFAGAYLLNDGAGTLARDPGFYAGSISFARATYQSFADVDADGFLDLSATSSTLDLYFGRGSLLETTSDWSDTDDPPFAWGDADGDGDLDLATWSFGTEELTVHRNEGWPTTETHVLAAGGRQLRWGDMNGDGTDEVVAARFGLSPVPAGRVEVVDVEAGGLTSLGARSLPGFYAQGHDLADVDDDGDLDVVVITRPREGVPAFALALLRNAGDGSLDAPEPLGPLPSNDTGAKYLTLADVDGDRRLDVVVQGDPLMIVGGRSDGTLRSATAGADEAADASTAVALADWDGDGDLDVAVANDEGPLRVYANDGAGGLTLGFSSDESPAARDVAWGDWDGDGDPDLAVAVEGAPNLLYENTGGALALWQETEESERSAAVAFADLDGDARMELAAGNLVGDTRVYENPGDGTLALRWSSGTDDVTNGLAIGDFDADGDLDLAEGNAGNNRIWRTADDGGLEEAWVATASDLTTAVDFGDFDGDGDLDLLAANEGADRVYRNDGGDTFAVGWDSGDASSTRSGAFVDYDDDGDDDAVWARRVGSSAVAIARDAFALEVDLPDARWNDVAVGDLDGDGDRDFVLVSDDPERAMAIAWSDARARTERWTQPYPSVRLVSPGGTAAMGGHGDATVRSWPTVPVRYAVRHDGEVAYRVELQRWRPGDRWRTATIGEPVDEGAEGDETLYRVDWDAAADGAWGDGVRLRLVLRFLMPRRIADSLRFADTASTSRAFRVGCLGPCCTRQLELADAGTVCRAEAGPCDVAESCDGSAPTCPADGFVEAGTACGFETGNACDPTDTCDGTQAECPETFAEDGSSCGADACTVATCTSGECVTEGAVDCDDGVVCTADWCDPASGCVHEEIEGCCVTDAECTAGADGVCEAGACVYGGDDDGGCGCRAPGRSPKGASPGGLALALLALVALRRRRA